MNKKTSYYFCKMNKKISYYLHKYLGSIIFSVLMPIWIIIVSSYAIMLRILNKNPNKIANMGGHGVLWLLKILVGIKVEFKGSIPKNGIVASEHQSTLETFALSAVLNFPAYILKKKLNADSFFWTSYEKR